MYIYVVVQEKENYYRDGAGGGRIKARIEMASGERCLIVPYQEFNMEVVRELRPRAIIMSGFGGHFQQRKVEWFLGMNEVLHQAEIPMLAFCGSHQLMAFAFNKDLTQTPLLEDEPIRRLGPEEDWPRVAQQSSEVDFSGYYMTDGFFPIWQVRDDPLFAGLPKLMMMRCNHYCEVKQLPPGFVVLARSGHSPIEAMRHQTRPLWGTQFHPEAYEPPFLDGRKLLENFAQIVRDFWAHSTLVFT
jgi:GMP synthase (glutamine-hydrolysing)